MFFKPFFLPVFFPFSLVWFGFSGASVLQCSSILNSCNIYAYLNLSNSVCDDDVFFLHFSSFLSSAFSFSFLFTPRKSFKIHMLYSIYIVSLCVWHGVFLCVITVFLSIILFIFHLFWKYSLFSIATDIFIWYMNWI